jgi:putative membrane protein
MFKLNLMPTILVAIAITTSTGVTAKTTLNPTRMQSDQSSTTLAKQPATQSEQPTASISPRQFVMKSSQGGMAEVELGRMASQRGSDNQVKQFGERMVQDHTKANDELKQLATSEKITLAKNVGEENQMVMQRLSKLSGAEFDRAYMKHMVEDHMKDVSLFEQEAKQGRDQNLKAWAAKTLPTLQEHLKLAQSIESSLGETAPKADNQ